ncbi:hypothetical protein C8J56DRAFT_817242 [Mycena floridula]|nr:hypothetical protein C8J56DRAFT_817242 [Mycena floridula]
MAQAGLLEWANTIRFGMVSDNGRTSFRDHVQSHGFLYLEDYFEEIIGGAKQGGLIDLVKTPGRKRTTTMKNKASSKLQSVMSWEVDTSSKENVSPARDLQQLFTNSKSDDTQPLSPKLPLRPMNLTSEPPQLLLEVLVEQPPVERNQLAMSIEPDDELTTDTRTDNGQLSIIAEGDESIEQSRHSIHLSAALSQPSVIVGTTASKPALPTHIEESEQTPISPVSEHQFPIASSAESFHSIPLDSPSPRAVQSPVPQDAAEQVVVEDDRLFTVESEVIDVVSQSRDEDVQVPLNDSAAPSSPAGGSQKPGDSYYPSLPAPMPMRKSIRDHTLTGPVLGAATPGAAAAGKRTSWLKKVREVKALESTSKKPSGSNGVAAGSKRNSGDMLGSPRHDQEGRHTKAVKHLDGDVAPLKPPVQEEVDVAMVLDWPESQGEQTGVLDMFKKTVEGLGARLGKSTGKSLGGKAAVNALAEARAAAEAKVAQRNHNDGQISLAQPTSSFQVSNQSPEQSERLRLSDLVPIVDKNARKTNENVFQFAPESARAPSPATSQGSAPVFNKHTPVFVPPTPVNQPPEKKVDHESNFPLHASPPFSMPASMSVGLGPRLPSPRSESKRGIPLSSHSTLETVASASIFDSQENPAWLPSTQDTDYTSEIQSQQPLDDADADDSWVDDKLPEGVTGPWNFGFGGEDSLTWSSAPTQSQKLDITTATGQVDRPWLRDETGPIPGSFNMYDGDDQNTSMHMEELNQYEPNVESVRLVEPPRSESQMSVASSTASSQPQGFLGHASKLVSSVLGTSKKTKTEVKSLQLAAAAAKREQEEKDKKASVLKNMEQRRQLAMQRRAEEEKAKAQDQERKLREDAERRKREREENTDKRPLKVATKKDEEPAKKRKVTVETKKPAPPKVVKLPTKHGLNASTSGFTMDASTSKAPSSSKPKAPPKIPVPEDDFSQPSQLLQGQMAARAKAQLQAAKQIEPLIPSEEIDLPDIRSDYSDSGDEDQRKYDPPTWAQSPELRQALESQSTINPDAIFGAVKPLRMEEVFQGSRVSKFRARTSSANWAGADRLTREEEHEYAKRMGFKK